MASSESELIGGYTEEQLKAIGDSTMREIEFLERRLKDAREELAFWRKKQEREYQRRYQREHADELRERKKEWQKKKRKESVESLKQAKDRVKKQGRNEV